MKFIGAIAVSALIFASCSAGGAGKAQSESVDSTVAQQSAEIELSEGSGALDEANMALVRDFYEKGVFAFDTEYVASHSTPEMVQKLCDANEYDEEESGGMALWVLRSGAQDGPSDVQEVLGVYHHGEDWYRAELNDMGNKVTVCLRVYEGKIADYSK